MLIYIYLIQSYSYFCIFFFQCRWTWKNWAVLEFSVKYLSAVFRKKSSNMQVYWRIVTLWNEASRLSEIAQLDEMLQDILPVAVMEDFSVQRGVRAAGGWASCLALPCLSHVTVFSHEEHLAVLPSLFIFIKLISMNVV